MNNLRRIQPAYFIAFPVVVLIKGLNHASHRVYNMSSEIHQHPQQYSMLFY